MLSSPSVRLPSRNLQKFARKIKLKQSRVWNCVLVPTAAGVGRCKDQGQLRCCSGCDAVRGADRFQHPRHRIGLNAITWTTSECVGPFLCCQASAVFFFRRTHTSHTCVITHTLLSIWLVCILLALKTLKYQSVLQTITWISLSHSRGFHFFSAGRRNVG